MSSIDLIVKSDVKKSSRVQLLSAMFDVPLSDVSSVSWKGELPIEKLDWQIGLIVGPSGSGKTTIAKSVFGEFKELKWGRDAVVDSFSKDLSIQEISEVCQSVGFNTIPAWMRPYHVLSNGEKFRVEIARRLLEGESPIVVDEFTSVVDRQIAQIGSHAVQKAIRKTDKKFVAVSCHYDIVEWLQPDWIFEPGTMTFQVRSLRRRPEIQIEIRPVNYTAWKLFAPFHYLTQELNRSARCFVLYANGQPASFGGMLHRPHPRVRDIMGLSRLVTLPDWQGLGLAMVLSDYLGAAYKAIGKRYHTYPAHPSLIRSFDKSPKYAMVKKPGTFAMPTSNKRKLLGGKFVPDSARIGGRPCAVFQYVGDAMSLQDAKCLLGIN